jgi:hypothetical protein
MNLVIDLAADLEAILKKRAEQVGLDISTYVDRRCVSRISIRLATPPFRTSNLKQASKDSVKYTPVLHRSSTIAANRFTRDESSEGSPRHEYPSASCCSITSYSRGCCDSIVHDSTTWRSPAIVPQEK